MSRKYLFAIIGGTGNTQLADFSPDRKEWIETPWGRPSAPVMMGDLYSVPIAFLPRHGLEHKLAPHLINYRANLWALDAVGVSQVLALAAVGGISREMIPGRLLIPDQLIDYTHGRSETYCEPDSETIPHIDFTDPFDSPLRRQVIQTAERIGLPVVSCGTYAVTQGPRLETAAEILRLERDGCDVVGMTVMPEAALARELGMAYACCALVSNWAAGKNDAPILRDINRNMDEAKAQLTLLLRAGLPSWISEYS
ncbi:MAG: S-methyl-5'-thioinosine phosphorylase [Gammaproteobacteria bacterium]